MSMEHTDDLRNVREGDAIEMKTATGTIYATCTSYEQQHADPRSGEVRETFCWTFDAAAFDQLVTTITEGLKSSPDDPDFPLHKPLIENPGRDSNHLGYIESIEA